MTMEMSWLRYSWLRHVFAGQLLLGPLVSTFLQRPQWTWKWIDASGVEHVNYRCFSRIDLPLLRFLGAHHEEP